MPSSVGVVLLVVASVAAFRLPGGSNGHYGGNLGLDNSYVHNQFGLGWNDRFQEGEASVQNFDDSDGLGGFVPDGSAFRVVNVPFLDSLPDMNYHSTNGETGLRRNDFAESGFQLPQLPPFEIPFKGEALPFDGAYERNVPKYLQLSDTNLNLPAFRLLPEVSPYCENDAKHADQRRNEIPASSSTTPTFTTPSFEAPNPGSNIKVSSLFIPTVPSTAKSSAFIVENTTKESATTPAGAVTEGPIVTTPESTTQATLESSSTVSTAALTSTATTTSTSLPSAEN